MSDGMTSRVRQWRAAWVALACAIALHVTDEAFEEVRRYFNEQEVADLTLAVVAINGWNRLNIAFRTEAGTYQPAGKENHRAAA